MPYVPRKPTTALCAHCNASFEKNHAGRKYCSNSCNVLAHYARNGRPGEPRATRADLEQTIAKMMELMNIKPELSITVKPAAPKPAPKALTEKPAAKAAVKRTPKTTKKAKTATKPAPPKPAAKAAATPPKKKITNPAPKAKPTAKKGGGKYEIDSDSGIGRVVGGNAEWKPSEW